MTIEYLKTAPGLPPQPQGDTGDVVREMLAKIAEGGETAVRDYAAKLDGWTDDVIVSQAQVQAAADRLSASDRAVIEYAHANIKRFAETQRGTAQDFEVELKPGLVAGQRYIPVNAAGAYVPGGRYAHIASALMTITTAKAAGVTHVTACSPTGKTGIPDAILYAMSLAGADLILALGGVQGVAAMAQGLFGAPPADILVGPGNHFVAEAKRQLYGPVGIDMVAGPTDIMVLADSTADPLTVAWDLVGQAEHGFNSPAWLATDDRALAEAVMRHLPDCIADLPEPNQSSARSAWEALGEVMVVPDRAAMADVANRYGPEHLHVQAADLPWWREALTSYGSLFLGETTCVAFGDKASGPNHVLPTGGAARYTGGLSVHKFLKCVTWQTVDPVALPELAEATAAISRLEGMEAHARTADIRLERMVKAPDVAETTA